MRLKLLNTVAILLLAGSGDCRPQQFEASASLQPKVENDKTEGWRPVHHDAKFLQDPIPAGKDLPQIVEGNSRVRISNTERDARNLPDIKLSLRTVATQLLNVSDPNESPKTIADLKNDGSMTSESKRLVTVGKIEKVEKSGDTEEKLKMEDKNLLIKEINSEISSLESIGVSFGRPTNSKFGYFESSHPGQAMAMTEEELERELSSKRETIPQKNQPTTSGGISTWILLNPPTTTPRTTQQETKKPETINKFVTKPTALIEKVEIDQKVDQKPTAIVEKIIPTQSSGKVSTNQMKPVTSNVRNTPKPTAAKPQIVQTPPKRVTQKIEQLGTDSTTPKIAMMTPVAIVEKNIVSTTHKTWTPTKKISPAQRTPPQRLPSSASTTVKPTTKMTKPNVNRGKLPARTTTTATPENQAEKISTTKIEKVTFRPVQMIPTPEEEMKTEKPVIAAKIKTPVPTVAAPKTTPATPLRSTTPESRKTTTVVRTDFTGADLLEMPVQTKPPITKVNNVLKAQLKKPVDEATKSGMETTKVNEPVLKIKKDAEEKIDDLNDQGVSQALNNSQIDLKFDFNPELTKIEMEISTEQPSVVTTTKKPRRNSQKRRNNKNKTRRRKPSTTTTESNEISTDTMSDETALQESKVEPETKEGTVTKIKKKQVQKPIGTQIYNYLSREIMPSFGVVSLVGLGLGIASYFLYPFGGGISRRNYEVEPNYKYNLGEYGGNYGQSEEEVFSKVLQGMTNHEAKYGGSKDYDQNNYYRYQQFGGPALTETKLSKKSDHRYPSSSSGPTYKPLENTYDLKYRNTEFKYPEVSTTPNYFERQKQSGYTVSNGDDDNRQFVVGNIPKEYNYDDGPIIGQKTPTTYDDNESGQTQFEQNIAQGFTFQKNSVNVSPLQAYGQPEALALKNDDNYAEIEITPTAVAVEHGPRALKVKRSVDEQLFRLHPRFRRDSVIQVIPPSGSQEADEKEENLSNEIFDILDLMIPGGDTPRKVNDDKLSNAIDNEEKTEKKREQEKTKIHETTTIRIADVEDTTKLVTTTVKPEETSPAAASSSATETQNIEVTSTSSTSVSEEGTTVEQPKDVSTDENVTEAEVKDLEDTTLEWIDVTTTVKTDKPAEESGFNIFNFVRTVAEVKFRLGLTILKHASEGFARYLGGIQKRINGEE